MKQIPLTQGKFALVDDEDFEWLNQWKWCAHKHRDNYRVVRSTKGGTVFMHRLIMGAPKDKLIDHVDRDPLNNQRSNLRFANHSENAANQGLRRTNKSGYKGVTWDTSNNKWRAQIQVKRHIKHLGRYSTIIEAAKAYNKAALNAFGEFAVLNIIRKRG